MLRNFLQRVRDAASRFAAALKAAAAPLKERRVIVAFAFLGVLHLFMALANTGSGWIYGHHGWAGARRSINARNYLRFGYVETRLAPLDNMGAVKTEAGKPVRKKIYWHHPVGFPLLLSAFFAVFGETPAHARLFCTLLSFLSFLMMIFIFRRSLGDRLTFTALLILTFIPLYAAYVNFVNYEVLVMFCALSAILLYEYYRERRRWWKIALVGIAVLAGAFSEYPIFPFYFVFWIVLSVSEIGDGRKNWKLPVLFPLFVVAGGILLLLSIKFMNEWTWEQMYKSFERLFLHRHSLKSESPHLMILEKWEFYYRFFNPIVMVLALYWVLDAAARALLRKWSRAEAYILALFLLAFCYWYLLPQAAKIHEYVVIYFCIPFAFAAAIGLWHLSSSISHGSQRLRSAVRLLVMALFIVTSIPILWSIRVFPTYKIVTPVHEMDSPKEYNYQISYNILASFVRNHTAPSEKVAFYTDFDIRPELWYYLDREHRVINKRREMLSTEKRGTHAFMIVNGNTIGVDFLSYLLERRNFAFIDHYYAFDLGKHMPSIAFLQKLPEESSALARYFISLPHPPYKVEEDGWRAVDLTLKLRGTEEAERLKRSIKPKGTVPLAEAIARYNLEAAQGGKPKQERIMSLLDETSNRIFAGSVEYLGSKIEKHGGISYIRLLFVPRKQLDFDFLVRVRLVPLHENEELRDEIGDKVRDIRFVIPSALWKPGLIYMAQDEILLFPGKYDLAFELVQTVTFQVMNESGNDNIFSITCKSIPPGSDLDADTVTSEIMGLSFPPGQSVGTIMGKLKKMSGFRYLVEKDLGSDMKLLGCLSAPPGSEPTTARLFFYNIEVDGRNLNLTLSAEGKGLKAPFKKSIDLGYLKGAKGPGRIFMVEEELGADPSKLKISLLLASKSVSSPLPSKEGPKVSLGKGDFGVHLPMQWLYWYGKIH